jgi:hypothetical protein
LSHGDYFLSLLSGHLIKLYIYFSRQKGGRLVFVSGALAF